MRRNIIRDTLWLVIAGVVAGCFVSILLIVAILLFSPMANGQPAASEIRRGGLLVRSEQNGAYFPAPALNTEVSVRILGMVARVRVKQHFNNPGDAWLEGVYVFPLPDNSAVDHLTMQIGARIVDGVIKERSQAAKAYQQARLAGRRASLVEQERPNIFTTSVANIGPKEKITVQIEYQQHLRYDLGSFSFRFPMVVGPRFIPGAAIADTGGVSKRGRGWSPNTTEVPDAARVTPPVGHPSQGRANPVSLEIDLDAGMPLAQLTSPYHSVAIDPVSKGRYRIRLKEGAVPADRDFVLRWTPVNGTQPQAIAFTESRHGDTYVLVMVLPPRNQPASTSHQRRELVFVIDTSGSMYGHSIAQARKALKLALQSLRPNDRFNIIQFNDRTHTLYTTAVLATDSNVGRAIAYVDALSAQSGTEMAPALRTALTSPVVEGVLRQVVFLTDGAVGNESALFKLIQRHLGESRLFTIGIGSAPNSHFMRKAARYGRGSFTYIGSAAEVKERVSALLTKLSAPRLTDVQIEWPVGTTAEVWPSRIPDLYAGEPITVAAKLSSKPETVTVTGRIAGLDWRTAVDLGPQMGGGELGVLWARRKISALMDKRRGSDDPDGLRQRIVKLALTYHLISPFTSLVAVERRSARPDAKDLVQRNIPTNLPHGWSYAKVFGGLPQTATSAPWQLLTAMTMLLAAGMLWIVATGLTRTSCRVRKE